MSELGKETEIRWVKQGSKSTVLLMWKDVVVFATERFLQFVETSRPDKKEILYNANSEVRGDGIDCVCTHLSLPCFAFSEKCRDPRILILIYPSFETIKTFESMTKTNYLQICFSEMEFLVALTGVPDHKLIIWNWRTTEKLYVQETKISGANQIIRISPTSPLQIIQFSGEEKRLTFWQMNLCYKKTLLNSSSILLPQNSVPPYHFAFGADGDVYFVDFEGSLYSINTETHVCTNQYTFSGTLSQAFIPCVTWYKGGIVFSTPNEVLFLRRKSPEGWAKIWSLTPKIPFRKIMAFTMKDLLIGVNLMNEILIFKGESQVECVSVKNFGADFEFVGFLYPLGDFFVTFGNATKIFNLWDTSNGTKVSQFVWTKDKINSMKPNPKWPYLVVTTAKGWVHLINAYDPNYPLMELDSINLTTNSLDDVRFRSQGSQFCVANMDVGEFFLLKVPSKIEVIAHVKLDLKIVDYAILDKAVQDACLVVVPMSQFCCRSGQTLLLYSLDDKKKIFNQVKDIGLPTIVTSILPHPTLPAHLFCIPHRSRKVLYYNILTGKVVSEFVSGHQMKFISLKCDDNHLYTFGPDGLVIVKLSSTKTCITLFCSHHRLAKGIANIAVNPGGYAIALGATGSLVCVYMKKLENTDRRPELEALKSSPAYKQLLLTPLIVKPKIPDRDQESLDSSLTTTWLVAREQELITQEEQQNKKERQNILTEFYQIKDQLVEMLDQNLENEVEKQLPIHAFDLDKAARRKKLEDAKAEREKEKQFRLANMKLLNKLADIIKHNCWESVAIKGKEIQGILSSISVQSYALFAESKSFNTKMTWLEEAMKVIHLFKKGDFFDPWNPRTENDLEKHIGSRFKVESLNVMHTIRTKFNAEQTEEDKREEDPEADAIKHVWSGTSTHNFIEINPNHYSQFELKTFLQSHQEVNFIQMDIMKLMKWFNKEFAEIFELKEREMEFVNERNNRLRHIIKELSFFNFSPRICNTQIIDPQWAPVENPGSIMIVQDKEIKSPKYVTESSMKLIRQKEEEEERLRLLMMTDDFKERALITMMDGVLEKLWEDEIKKDVPRPKCLVENKDPSNWTDDDLKAMRAYEEAVRFLKSERERYRKQLEARWTSTILTIKDSVMKFDDKLNKLHVLKLKVEAAILQETLKALRIRENCLNSMKLQRRKETIKLKMAKNEKKIETMSVELNKLVEMLGDCKIAYESLQNKDKNLDKNFKREFPDYSPIICEQLYKISKKRPKLIQKAAIYSTVLNDLGKCAISGTKPEYMPTECIQYLKDIDALDSYSNAPASVSQQSWELACKLRRMKIDTELKIRACAIDLTDAEATVTAYQKELKATKEEHSRLQNDLHAVLSEKADNAVNFAVQLVLKKGLVEVPLTGNMSDFNESVLVTKDTVKEVNKAIQKMGQQKIKAMQKAANFRKGIIYKEWEHKKLRMEIEDLKGQLETIEKLQVLKELQAILVARARGFSDEKGFLYLENELAKVKQKFEKDQTTLYQKIDEFEEKITKLNATNEELDLKILEVNVEVNEMNLSRDMDFDKKYYEENMRRMKKIRERGKLVRKIQDQHNEILVLQTELELLRLKTYPTIKYKIS